MKRPSTHGQGRPGRSRKRGGEGRTVIFTIRFRPDEHELLVKAAVAQREFLTDWIRHVLVSEARLITEEITEKENDAGTQT